MIVFLDFEASSLSKHSYPIEVGWVFEDGRSEAYLIRPAPEWTEWDPASEAIHHIPRAQLAREGTPHDVVAARMIEMLDGHELFASAPSWDGKWLSTLLRAAGLPRHRLRLRDSDDLLLETAREALRPRVIEARLEEEAANLVALAQVRAADVPPAHRALADAAEERERWLAVQAAGRAAGQAGGLLRGVAGGSDAP